MNKQLLTRLVFSFLMSMCMAFFMSGWVTFVNIGFESHYFKTWMRSFMFAWPAAFTIVIILAPFIHKITAKIVGN
ncbi:DUF2798 domain-containing protein [Thorsellia kenyensis]|uniref:DUF2798 domain-containing protein n=1 Tax=Thorsellia kenyensis TaxID=1549888 RepID=A0ABV6CD88_9GAMM